MTRLPPSEIALGAAALLAFVIPAVVLSPDRVPPVSPTPTVTSLRLIPVPLIAPTLAAPLFDASRKPLPPPAPPAPIDAAPPPPPTPPPVLVGVVTRPGGGGVALVRKADGTTVTVATGAEVEGWRLLDVTNGSARFVAGDRQESVVLDFANKPKGGGTPVSGVSAAAAPAPAAPSSPSSSPALAQPGPPAAPLAEPPPSRPR